MVRDGDVGVGQGRKRNRDYDFSSKLCLTHFFSSSFFSSFPLILKCPCRVLLLYYTHTHTKSVKYSSDRHVVFGGIPSFSTVWTLYVGHYYTHRFAVYYILLCCRAQGLSTHAHIRTRTLLVYDFDDGYHVRIYFVRKKRNSYVCRIYRAADRPDFAWTIQIIRYTSSMRSTVPMPFEWTSNVSGVFFIWLARFSTKSPARTVYSRESREYRR